MKKIFPLFIVVYFILVGCTLESKNEIKEKATESLSETNSNKKMKYLELKGKEEIEIFERAVSNSKKEPGIVNMANPEYQFRIDEDTYFLWITEESGTIMNTKDTHTIYTLSSSTVKEVFKFINIGI